MHARAVLGLPISEITLERNGASAVILADKEGTNPTYNGVEDVVLEKNCEVRIFGKPTTRPYRRMAVVLTYDKTESDVQAVKNRAIALSKKIQVQQS